MLSILLNTPVDMPVPLGFESWLLFWLIVVISAVNGILMLFAGYKFLQIIQLSGYNLKGLSAWLRETKGKYWGRLIMLSFLSSACLLMTNVLLESFFVYKIMTYIGLLFYLVFCIVFIRNIYNAPQKTPLKYTRRMNRLSVVLFLVVFVATFFIMTFSTQYIPYFDYGAVGLTPIFLPILVVIAFLIIEPFEVMNNLHFVKKAKKIILARKDLINIGITGSYGKTSVKNILSTILSEKYNVCATPYSYNTPLGLSKTIIGTLRPEHQVFIAEMGAKNTGDIRYLTQMVKPEIGIVTGIGNQHLSTFGTIEKLKKTKFELVENLCDGGTAYFNGDSMGAVELYEKAATKKVLTSIESQKNGFYVKNIVTSERGSTFDLALGGKKPISCSTILLGEHNISNILLCAAVAFDMGLKPEEIRAGIEKLLPSAHRLAIVPSGNSLIILDDAYNGSVEGSKAALNVLAKFSGQKIVVTPGLVELGTDSFNSNFEFGKNMAKICDYVVINGVVNYEPIYSGLLFGGFDESKILRAGSLAQATNLVNSIAKPGDAVLFENDLPDNYT